MKQFLVRPANHIKRITRPDYVMAQPMRFIDFSIMRIIRYISHGVYYPAWMWRNRSLRNGLMWFAIGSLLVIEFFGLAAFFSLISTAGQFVFAAVFMIAQFAFLFFFLSSTKNIETVPGDVGLVSFAKDYFGNQFLVDAVMQTVSLMTKKNRARLDALGAEPINGLMLVGPPGTGKTLLAQCLAYEIDAAFIGMSGTDFQAMFIGVGPMKVMRTAAKAQNKADEYGSCIVFIDEIDAIGQSRGGVEGEQNQPQGGAAGGMFGGGGLGVLSKLLTVMDGTKDLHLRKKIENYMRAFFGYEEITQGQVLWMGATNRPSSLDPALIRPGRIDQMIQVDPPDKGSRRKIVDGYLGKIVHDDTVDAERLTEDTQGVTPADLANAIQRGSARFTIMDDRDAISMHDIEEALQQSLVGLANPISEFDPKQKEQVASHESGHALMSHLLLPWRRITTVSIIRRGKGILGYMRDVSSVEVYAQPFEHLLALIQVGWAGDIATEVLMGERWTGASGDLQMIENLKKVLASHGVFAGKVPLDGMDIYADPDIEAAASAYDLRAQEGTRKLLDENREVLEALRDALIETDELNSEEVYDIFKEHGL